MRFACEPATVAHAPVFCCPPDMVWFTSVCRVVGLEHMPELVEYSKDCVSRISWAAEMMKFGQLSLVEVLRSAVMLCLH